MMLSRARRLSLARTTVQGAAGVSVAAKHERRAPACSRPTCAGPRSRSATASRSSADRAGARWNCFSCISRPISSQNLKRMIPSSTSIFSKPGACLEEHGAVAPACRSPSPARRRRDCTRSGRRARFRRPSAAARHSAGNTIARARPRSASAARPARAVRGLRYWRRTKIAPPLPAASRPSKTSTTRLPVSPMCCCSLTSSICSSSSSSS